MADIVRLRVMTVFLRFAMKRYNHGARRRDLDDHGISTIGCAARRSHGTLAASSAEALVSYTDLQKTPPFRTENGLAAGAGPSIACTGGRCTPSIRSLAERGPSPVTIRARPGAHRPVSAAVACPSRRRAPCRGSGLPTTVEGTLRPMKSHSACVPSVAGTPPAPHADG